MLSAEIRQIDKLPAPLRLYGAALLTAAKKPSPSSVLPSFTLLRPAIRFDKNHITRYATLCGFQSEHGIPLTYPHILAFPLHMLLMADPSFPYSMMGLVHLANTVRQHRPLGLDATVQVKVRCDNPQRHEKGQAFSLLTQIRTGDELAWESESIYLRTGFHAPTGSTYQSQLSEVHTQQPTQTWQIETSIGRRYGLLSGDINPIHLHRVTAMALGFPHAIAHGMWAKARSLAALMPARPTQTAFARVEFKTPLFLPAQATLWVDPDLTGSGQCFELSDVCGEKPHLRGLWHT